MENFSLFWDKIATAYGYWGIALVGLILVFFIIQLCYYLGSYSALPRYKNNSRPVTSEPKQPISIILSMGEDYLWLEDTLPMLLTQEYDKYEIIVVYVGNDVDFAETLQELSISASNSKCKLICTQIKQSPMFPISLKMALNVGIKAASYDRLIITTPDMQPVSSKRWLASFENGFSRGDVVLGYCGIAPTKGFMAKMIRTSNMIHSVRSLCSAINGHTYKGSIQNIGFMKKLYFENKGFGYLNMNLGEADLFIQQIASQDNTSIVLNPNSSVRQKKWGGLGWWLGKLRRENYTYRYYTESVQNYIFWEPLSRLLFIVTAIAALILLPLELKIVVAGIIILRYLTVIWHVARISHRLGEKGLIPTYLFYDIFSPLFECGVRLSEIVKPAENIWR